MPSEDSRIFFCAAIDLSCGSGFICDKVADETKLRLQKYLRVRLWDSCHPSPAIPLLRFFRKAHILQSWAVQKKNKALYAHMFLMQSFSSSVAGACKQADRILSDRGAFPPISESEDVVERRLWMTHLHCRSWIIFNGLIQSRPLKQIGLPLFLAERIDCTEQWCAMGFVIPRSVSLSSTNDFQSVIFLGAACMYESTQH